MKKGTIALLVIGGLLLLFIIWGVSGYNSLVKEDEDVTGTWHKVEAEYQRRMDLIPNLVSTVQGYANFEKSTLTDVINARSNATKVTIDADHPDAASLKQLQQAQAQVGSSLSRLLVTVEQYPDLKANQSFLQLQAQLEGTENRITFARNTFNTSAQTFDTHIRQFPANIFAGMFGLKYRDYFEADQGASKAPTVKF